MPDSPSVRVDFGTPPAFALGGNATPSPLPAFNLAGAMTPKTPLSCASMPAHTPNRAGALDSRVDTYWERGTPGDRAASVREDTAGVSIYLQ